MILKNYYKAIGALMMKNETAISIVDVNGSKKSFKQNPAYSDAMANYALGFQLLTTVTQEKGSSGCCFGTGTTPPSYDDFWLSGDVVTGLTCSATATYTVDDGDVPVVSGIYTITNNNDTPITIGEIGYVGLYNGSPSCHCMVERTVLDNPITIEPGGVGQVTYTIRMNYPTA